MRITYQTLLPIFISLTTTLSCRTRPSDDSAAKSGPGGAPSQWTCAELKSEYKRLRPELDRATKTFLATKESLGAAGNGNPVSSNVPPPPQTTTVSTTESATGALDSLIAQGSEAVPTLPDPLKSFPNVWENGASIPGKNAVGCDNAYNQYSIDSNNHILEQCRYLVKMNNLLINISAEYNLARDGECRSGKATTQTQQVSTIFPYCVNPCRFGLTTCAKCEFTIGRLTSSFICGEEQDARQTVAAQCANSSCSNAEPTCKYDVFNDLALGTTANKDSTTRLTVRTTIGTRFNIEATQGAILKANASTRIDTSIEGRVMLKNGRGAPILTNNGAETATTYSCAVTVAAASVSDVGIEVGLGFDIIVARGGQTVTSGTTFELATAYNSQSRDISAAGLTMAEMVRGCTTFATNWAQNDLPALLKENIALKVVAAKYLGKTKDVFPQDIAASNTYCKTDRRQSYLFSNTVQYEIKTIWWDLQEKNLGMKYRYSGSFFSYNSPVFTFNEADLGPDLYKIIRKEVFDGSVSIEHIRDLIQRSYDKNGWVKTCQTGEF